MKDFNNLVIPIIILSIENNAISLRKQLEEYNWLEITPEQIVVLCKIEREFHALVQEITK